MPVRVEFLDEASPWLEWATKEFPQFAGRALKSLGWWTQKKVKEGIESNAPGGNQYAATTPLKLRRKIERAFGHKVKGSYPILGKLRKAIGYEYDKSRQQVTVGWLSVSAVKLAAKLESGFETRVTGKMARALYRAGLSGVLSRGTIKTPARPTIGPMYDKLESEFATYYEDKILSYMHNAESTTAPKTKRRYIVKGGF